LDRHAAGLTRPSLLPVAILLDCDLITTTRRSVVRLASLEPHTRRLPTPIGPNHHMASLAAKRGATPKINRHPLEVIVIVERGNKRLPLGFDIRPIRAIEPLHRIVEIMVRHMILELTKSLTKARLRIEKLRRRPTPRIRPIIQ